MMAVRLLIATGNAGKLREFRALFAGLRGAGVGVGGAGVGVSGAGAGLRGTGVGVGGVEVGEWELVAPGDVGLGGFEVVEDGETYMANAARKARAYANAARLPALADDSGLEVDALGGAPGVYSARYAGAEADDAANRAKLLAALGGAPASERGARFRCVVALAYPFTTNVRLGEGAVEGRIAMDERGDLGFGYDPVFELPDGRRMAELSAEQKNAISHRARALADARWALAALYQTSRKSAGGKMAGGGR